MCLRAKNTPAKPVGLFNFLYFGGRAAHSRSLPDWLLAGWLADCAVKLSASARLCFVFSFFLQGSRQLNFKKKKKKMTITKGQRTQWCPRAPLFFGVRRPRAASRCVDVHATSRAFFPPPFFPPPLSPSLHRCVAAETEEVCSASVRSLAGRTR